MKKALLIILICLISAKVYPQANKQGIHLVSEGSVLNAHMYIPGSNSNGYTLILLHGYPGGEGDPLSLGARLSSLGTKVLVFNYRGTWSSEGEFSFETSMQDVTNAISFLKLPASMQEFGIDTSKIIVGGYSFGGAMALTEAVYNPDIRRIISIAGADESVFGRKMLSDENFRVMLEGMIKASEYPKGPVKFDFETYIPHWLSHLDRFDLLKHAGTLANREILFIIGWNDAEVLPEEHMLPLFRELQLLGAKGIQVESYMTDHSFRNVRDELTETIYQWILNDPERN